VATGEKGYSAYRTAVQSDQLIPADSGNPRLLSQAQFEGDLDVLTGFSLLGEAGIRLVDGQLVFERTATNGVEHTGLLSEQSYRGDLEVILEYASLSQFSENAYQPNLILRLTDDGFDQQTLNGRHVSVKHKIHSGIPGYTWFYQWDDQGQSVGASFPQRRTSGKLRLLRRDGVVSGYILDQNDQWLQINQAEPGAFLLEGPARVNVYVDAQYNDSYRYVFEGLTIRHDEDGDGLLNQEEALLGTDPVQADSDGDGLGDRADLRPLDAASRRAYPLGSLFPNPALDVSIHKGTDGRLLILVRNDHHSEQLFTAQLPGLSANSLVEVVFEQRSLQSQADSFSETLPANSRRVYRLDYDLAPLFDPADFVEIVQPMAAGAWSLDLTGLALDLEQGAGLSWAIESVDDANLTASLDGAQLTLTPQGAVCGLTHVRLSVSDAQGRSSQIALPVRLTGAPGAELIANGGMEQFDADPLHIPGWTDFRWEGDIQLNHTDLAAFAGERSALIQGYGPAKAAIYQNLSLPVGTYRLRAKLASADLREGLWGQTSLLYLEFASRETISQTLLEGDNDWRQMELVFRVPEADQVTLYFFNYGPGSLFVDDVSLSLVEACAQPEEGFSLGETSLKPLDYNPPVSFEEILLHGYCDDESFAGREVCQRLQGVDIDSLKPQHAAAPRLLADFEQGSTPPFIQSGWDYTDQALNGERSVLLQPGRYLDGWNAQGIPSDWRGYDWLRFEVDNPSTEPQRFYVEIRDVKSNDYWSRVNWYTVAAPGRSTIQVPLQIFVGEKSVIRERRRLDLANITRLVLSAADAAVALTIDDVRLEPEPAYSNDFPRLIKLDVGSLESPLFHEFTPLYASTSYRAQRGYGFSADAEIKRTEDRRHPENLLRDWISLNSGGLDFDLPDGEYHVWMVLEDPGYWEYYPNYEHRAVYAEGEKVLDEQPTVADFWARYYRHDDAEDLPGDDIWQRYIPARYQPLQFDVLVSDGQLNLRFEGNDSPYTLALSALVIYPTSEAARGEAFLAELWQQLKQQYGYEYKQVAPPLPQHVKPTGNALDGALSLFQRSSALDVYATDWPDAAEQVDALSASLAQGEYEPLTISLYAHQAQQLTDAVLELPGVEVTASQVRNKLSRVTQDGSVYTSRPRILDPLQLPLELAAGQSRRLWFDLHAPAELAPGTIEGSLRLSFSNGQSQELPVSVEVRPYSLPAADVPLGYLGLAPQYPGSGFPEVAAKQEAELQASIALLHRYGMTGVDGGIGGPLFKGYSDGQPVIDFSQADKTMAALQGLYSGEINSYGGIGIQGLSTYSTQDTSAYGKPYVEVLADLLAAIESHGAANNWLSLIHTVGDEPEGEAIQDSLAAAQAFHQADPQSRTSVFSSLTDPASDPRAAFAGVVDRIYVTHHSAAGLQHIVDRGSECATYNLRSRYHRGVYQYKLAREFGCRGHMQFMWSSVHADPWYDLDGRESEQAAVFTHADGSLRHTLELERYREAVDDYRYLLKLEQQIAASDDSTAKAEAQAWLQATLDAMEIGHDRPHAWSEAELDGLRQQAAAHIEHLLPDYDADGIPDALDADDDNDTLPDDWELRYGLNPLDASDATSDVDGDGFSNRVEFQANSDPTDPSSTPTGEHRLGTVLTDVRDWSGQRPFIDLFKVARPWFTQCDYWVNNPDPGCTGDTAWYTGENALLDLDENGWVRSVPAPGADPVYTSVATYWDVPRQFPAGRYLLLYDGEGTLEYLGGMRLIEEESRPGRHVVMLDRANGGFHLRIRASDPNGTGDYIRNMRLIPEAFETVDPLPLFNPEFLERTRPFQVLNFKYWMRIDDAPPATWAERPLMDRLSYAGEEGVPAEVMVALADAADAAPWFNMPHNADDDYVRQFATLVRDRLRPDLPVYLEYAHDFMFSANGGWIEEQGKAAWPEASESDLQKRFYWYGKRAAEMCDIWKSVWADGAGRVHCVVESQIGNSWISEQILECPLWEGAPCAGHGLDALAITPQFGGYLGITTHEQQVEAWTQEADGGLTSLFREVHEGGLIQDGPPGGALAAVMEDVEAQKAVADRYGMALVGSRGGEHIAGNGAVIYNEPITQLFIAANRDPRMGRAYTDLLDGWAARGGGLFMHQKDIGAFSQYGSWSALENLSDTHSPKYDALLGYLNGTPYESVVSLDLSAGEISEQGGAAALLVNLDRPYESDVTVQLGLQGGAQEGSDYTLASHTVTLPTGQTSASVTLTALDDELIEGRENVQITIVSVSAGLRPIRQSLRLEIFDEDVDGDAMADDWERHFGLDPNDPNDAHQDSDGDGIDNLAEFTGRTDPTRDQGPPPRLGGNLGGIVDWTSQSPFIDLFKMSREWLTQCDFWANEPEPDCSAENSWDTGEQALLDLDEHGWVRSMPAPADDPIFTRVTTYWAFYPQFPGGRYVVLYDGAGTMTYGLGAHKIDAESSPGRHLVVFDPGESATLTIAATDPDGTGDYIRNIRIIPEALAEELAASGDPVPLFKPAFLEKTRPYQVLRFMDMMRTNNSPLGRWADRPEPLDARYTTDYGVPLEVMTELSNTLQRPPWFTLPHQADDDFVRQFARLAKEQLDPTLRVYLEYSNEVWNGQFEQSGWVRSQGEALWPDAVADGHTKLLNWFGKRTAEICHLWKQVWGNDAYRVTCVMGAQAAWSRVAEQALECPLWDEGPCIDHGIDALAIAPYIDNLGLARYEAEVEAWTQEADGGLTRLFNQLEQGGELSDGPPGGQLAATFSAIDTHIALAAQYGLPLYSYEGGQHLVGVLGLENNQALTDLFIAANRDPRMGTLYDRYLAGWESRGGALFMNFSDIGRPSKWGSWGALEYLEQESSPKYAALMRYLGIANDGDGVPSESSDTDAGGNDILSDTW
jgi:hypothetical protein